jgi:hypothetical protein
MNITRRHLSLAVLALPSVAVRAQGAVSPLALVGQWTTTEMHASGAMLSATVRLLQTMEFRGSASVNGKVTLQYAGTWALEGQTLRWLYTESSAPIPAIGQVDVDELVSVDQNRLVLRSTLSGKQQTFIRVP